MQCGYLQAWNMSAPCYQNGRSLAGIFLVHHKERILMNQLLCDPFSQPWSEKRRDHHKHFSIARAMSYCLFYQYAYRNLTSSYGSMLCIRQKHARHSRASARVRRSHQNNAQRRVFTFTLKRTPDSRPPHRATSPACLFREVELNWLLSQQIIRHLTEPTEWCKYSYTHHVGAQEGWI